MPNRRFKAGNRVAPVSPAQITIDNSPCKGVYIRAHKDNSDDIIIGDNEYLDGHANAVKAAATITTGDGDLTITAAQGGSGYNGDDISFVLDAATATGAPTVINTGGTIVITVNSTVNTTTASINTALHGLTNWSSAVGNAGNFNPGDMGLTDATSGGDSVPVVASFTLSITNGNMVITSAAGGTAWNGAMINLIDGGPGCSPSAAYDPNTGTLVLTYDPGTTTFGDLAVEVSSTASDWVLSPSNAAVVTTPDQGIYGPTANGLDGAKATASITTADSGKITITAAAIGTAWNSKDVVLAVSNSVPASTPTATYDGNTITITVNAAGATTIANMVTAVALLTDWGATETTGGSCEPKDAGITETTSGGVEEARARGLILAGGEDVTVEVDSVSELYCYSASDMQVLSWVTKGV